MKYDTKMNIVRFVVALPLFLVFAYDGIQWGYMKYLAYSTGQQENALFRQVYGTNKVVTFYKDGKIPRELTGEEKEKAALFFKEQNKIYDKMK